MSFSSFNQFRQFGNDAEGIAHDEQIGELANRCGCVFVDGDDRPRRAHPDFVLYRTRDADRYVELRRYRFSGLPDLKIVRHPAGIGRRPRCARRLLQALAPRVSTEYRTAPVRRALARPQQRRALPRALTRRRPLPRRARRRRRTSCAGFRECDDLARRRRRRCRERARPDRRDAVLGRTQARSVVISAPPSFGETQTTMPSSTCTSTTSATMPALRRTIRRPATSRPESVFGMRTSEGPTSFGRRFKIIDRRIEQEGVNVAVLVNVDGVERIGFQLLRQLRGSRT